MERPKWRDLKKTLVLTNTSERAESEVQILQGPRRYVVDTDGYLGPNGVPYKQGPRYIPCSYMDPFGT